MPRKLLIFASLIALALLCIRLIAQPAFLPSNNMKPALLAGDFIMTGAQRGALNRGQIVVFLHPVTGRKHISRVIALGGDSVEIRAGEIVLNGALIEQIPQAPHHEIMRLSGPNGALPRCESTVGLGAICTKQMAIETLPNGQSYHVLNIAQTRTDTMAMIEIPDGMAFVLGDNRDNSLDSRTSQAAGGIGLVPLENITRRLRFVAFSAKGTNPLAFWTWRGGRFLLALT